MSARIPSAGRPRGRRPSRRDFLKLSALAAAAVLPAPLRAAIAPRPAEGFGRGNRLPGRIVICHDSDMYAGLVFNSERIAATVAQGVRLLSGEADTGLAFASLFPGLQAASRIAIKVNCIGPVDTRWQTVHGILAGLTTMLGGTYDLGNVIVYDERYIGGHDYTAENLEIAGVGPVIASGLTTSHNYLPVPGHKLCDYLIDYDYLINVPVLKSHTYPFEITAALKNHFGSCSPANICGTGGAPKMLLLNADPYIRDKTSLVVTDALRGTYNGGPTDAAQIWSTFPDGTPNTLSFGTDPVTNEYWGRDMINAERIARGWSPKACAWIEDAGEEPYSLGVADPAQMAVIRYDPAALPDEIGPIAGGVWLAPNAPNPFRDRTDLRLHLPARSRARLVVVDAAGRLVRDYGEREYPGGFSTVPWDGRDDRGRALDAGAYFARLAAGPHVVRQALRLVR